MSGRNTLQSREKKKRAEDFYLSDVWLLRVVSSAWCYINHFFLSEYYYYFVFIFHPSVMKFSTTVQWDINSSVQLEVN